MKFLCSLCCCLLFFLIPAAEQQDGIFKDTQREREVPYRCYYPKQLEGKYPVIIFSHGLGGSIKAAAYLGEHLADNGYICFHIQHHGSDVQVWKGERTRNAIIQKLAASIKQPKNALNRFTDLPAFVKHLHNINQSDAILKGYLNLERIGMAGHSYGARSTMAAAGELMSPFKISYKEPSIKAAVVLSPSEPERVVGNIKDHYKEIDIPLFHMTGTTDGFPLPHQKHLKASDRVKPYLNLDKEDQYLLVLKDADHATFSGNRLGKQSEKKTDKEHTDLVKQGALAFYNAYLKESAEDKRFLRNEFKEQAQGHRFEWKKDIAK